MKPEINKQIELCLDWCKFVADMTEQTISSKSYILWRFVAQTHIKNSFEITNELFNRWKNGMLSGSLTGRKHRPNTCNVRIRTVRAFVKWLKSCGVQVPIQTPFMQLVRQNEDCNYIFYTREQIRKVLNMANSTQKAMISLMFESGLRLTEFQNIKIEDIDFRENSITVLGKGRKRGKVFFTAEVHRFLLDYLFEKQIPSGFLWQSMRNNYLPYTRDALRAKMREPFEKAGFYGFTPHQLRHSFATDLIENGATIFEVQKLLRHNSSRTTETYIHNLQNSLPETYARLKKQGIYNEHSIYWTHQNRFEKQR